MAEQKATSPPLRARNQQNVISIFCMCAAVTVFIWLIFSSIGGLQTSEPGNDSGSTSAVAADNKQDNVKKEDDTANADSNTAEELQNEKSPADFSDSCFIGDSRTVGLSYNSGKPMATFYCATGLNVSSALDEKNIELDNGYYGNVVEALQQRQFGRIFIMFGINEVGWPYVDVFQSEYEELINAVKAAQPDAKIYVQLIIPVTASRSAQGDSINNTNVATFNEAVKAAAENCGVEWIDVSPALVDENGDLPEDAASDGIHLVKDYLLKWIDYLEKNT